MGSTVVFCGTDGHFCSVGCQAQGSHRDWALTDGWVKVEASGLAYIRSVETTYADGARRCRLVCRVADSSFDGLTALVEANGRVTWCDDWARLTDWSLAGYVRRVFHPGHGDPCAQYEEYFVMPYERKEA